MVIVSSSIIDVVNLNDTKPLQLFLGSNQPKTQIYSGNTGAFTPDWNTTNPVLTPELYIAGTATNIIAQAKSISWFDGASPITGGTAGYTLGTGNQTLTINTNLLAGKNLVPSFDSSRWFADSYNGPGAMVIDATDRYKMTLTITATSEGRLVQIPVISGKTYTLSYSAATTGMVKFYKGQQTTDNSSVLLTGSNGTGTGNFTFTVDSSYSGYVTIRLVQGTAGSYVFQDIQLEMASSATAFAPMDVDGTKSIVCEVVYTDPDTSTDIQIHGQIDFALTATAQNGAQGNTANDIGYLNNETAVVTAANDGSGGTYGAPNTQSTLQIFRGLLDVTSQYTIAQTRNNVTVTEATNSATATVTAMNADTGSVVFTATLANYPTITKTFSLAKSKMGVVGQTPTSYWLTTSATSISVADDGSYSPSSVTVGAESQAGTAAVANYSGRFIISESTDGNSFTAKYTSAADESSHAYTPSGAGVKAIKVTLYQAGGTSTKLDEQNISMVGNGKNSVTVNAWTPQGNIIRNAANTVTAQADILNGGNLTTADNYRWVKQNPQAPITLLNGTGWEDLDLGKDNVIPNSDLNVTTGWGGYNSVDPTGYIPGTKSVTLTRSGYAGTNRTFIQNNLPSGALVGGKTYTFSCWFKLNSSTPMDNQSSSFFVRCYDNTNSTFTDIINIGINSTTYAYDQWHFVQATGTYPAAYNGTGYMQPSFGLGYNGSITTSNWKLEEGTQASTWNKRFTDLTIDPTDNTLYGENLAFNGDFAITATNSSVGWDNTLNGTMVPNSGWSNGYNSGVPAPTTGYHAHLSSTKFGYPVLEFIDKNSTYGYAHRWLGMSEWVSPSQVQFQVGQTYTISYEAQTDTANMVVNVGMYHYLTSGGSQTFNGFQWTLPALTTTNTWIKQYKTFTVDSTWDVTKATSIYVYGYYSSVEGTIWVRNVKLEAGPIATDFTNRPEDNSANYPKQTAGLGKWIYKNFPNAGAITTAPSYSTIQGETTGLQKLIAESSNLVQSAGNDYTGYLKTAVYSPTAKAVNVSLQHDDGMQAYLNGVSIYKNDGWTPNPVTIAYNFQPGWNTVEFIWNQGNGGDGVYNISPAFGTIGEELNANYALDYGSLKGNYGIIGYNTNNMVINTNAVTDVDQFQCVVTYRGSTYKDTVTIEDITDPIVLQVVGSASFKNGQGTNTYTARLYQNGNEIDASGTLYTYTWNVYNKDGSLDSSFGGSGSKTGKTITVAASDINVQGTLTCDVTD